MSCLFQILHRLKQVINKWIRTYIHNKWVVFVILMHSSSIDSFLHSFPQCPILVLWCYVLEWLYPYNWALLLFQKSLGLCVCICPRFILSAELLSLVFLRSLSKLLCKCLSPVKYCLENGFYYYLLILLLEALCVCVCVWHSIPL